MQVSPVKFTIDHIEKAGFLFIRDQIYEKKGHYLKIFGKDEDKMGIYIWKIFFGFDKDLFFGHIETEFEFRILLKMLNLHESS